MNLPTLLKTVGAGFGLGAVAADALGGWVSLLGLLALIAGFAMPMLQRK